MRTADFDYRLPPELIAQAPLPERDRSRLLVVDRAGGTLAHRSFADFATIPAPDDVLVVNDSRVIPARLLGRRVGGGKAEVLLVAREDEGTWRALVRPGSRIHAGDVLRLAHDDRIEILAHLPGGVRRVRLTGPGGEEAVLARRGRVPLPPYIRREPTDLDTERYQTVYATAPGSVAAPTAGLHFTSVSLGRLQRRGVNIVRVTLHVGPGTFRPVTAKDPASHHLDAEWYVVAPEAAATINAARRGGAAVWAVGTTATRTLETCADEDGMVRPGFGWTSLFIRPGHTFRVVDHLLTNFHLPKSTLLMLVSAFAGRDLVMRAYEEAIREKYRFYSYGDAMLIL
jgi:S-adenosylmethionine:tRNA ribosyltransferase-isomerase